MEIQVIKNGVKVTATDCGKTECGYFSQNTCGKGLLHQTGNCIDTTNKPKMMVLPPAPDKCQVCAVAHKPESPHNKDSLYYQMNFHNQNGRWPTWEDSMAHCPDDIKRLWIESLEGMGIEWRTAFVSNEIKPEGIPK